jgi:hypothetical protein
MAVSQKASALAVTSTLYLGNHKCIKNREQLIQELEQSPNDLVQTVLDFLHGVKAIQENHPLAKFA